MLDMYSRHSVLESTVPAGKRLVDVAPYFDPFADNEFIFYECIRLPVGPQCLVTAALACLGICLLPPTMRSQSDFIWKNFHSAGGILARLIAASTVLFHSLRTPPMPSEHSFIFGLSGNSSSLINHAPSLVRHGTADLPTRLMPINFRENPSLSFYHAHSRYYHGPQTLISEGFMQAIDWSSKNSHDQFTYIAPAEEKAP